MSDLDVLRHSVTRDDRQQAPGGGVFWLNAFGGMGGMEFLIPPAPPTYWSMARDQVLLATLQAEDMWAAAIGKAISKIAARGFTVSDSQDSAQRIKRSQEQFLYANEGRGWVHFISQHLRAYLMTDGGAVIETVRASSAAGARILGFVHLDPLRTRRTGDPERPAVYTDFKGVEHILKTHQVSFLTDMPDPRVSLFGVGYCAASRAYRTIYKLAAITQYFSEKITGRGANAVHFVDGITDRQLEDAFATAEAGKVQQGIRVYKGQVFISSMKGVQAVNTVDLASVADGFNAKEERDNGYIVYANAIGIAVQDIQPLQGQGLGSGTQTVILDEAAEGQGLASWAKQWEHWASNLLLPATTTFSWNTNDIRDKKAQAEVAKLHAETRGLMITDGTITPPQALQLAVDADDLPREFLSSQDQTAGDQLLDTEKPIDEGAAIPVAAAAPAALPGTTTTKATVYPQALERLIARLTAAIEDGTSALEVEQITPDTWRAQLKALLERYTGAAWKAGQDGAALDKTDVAKVKALVQSQLGYLDNFTTEIKDGDRWNRSWASRAAMYAESIKVPYWQAKTKVLPLPAMPAEGTTCLSRCKCMWDVTTIDADAGDYDARWVRGTTDSCQVCIQRATDWAPLQIRGGVLL